MLPSRIVQTLNVLIEIFGGRKRSRNFSVRQDPIHKRRVHTMWVCTSSGLHSLRACMGLVAFLGNEAVLAGLRRASEKEELLQHLRGNIRSYQPAFPVPGWPCQFVDNPLLRLPRVIH